MSERELPVVGDSEVGPVFTLTPWSKRVGSYVIDGAPYIVLIVVGTSLATSLGNTSLQLAFTFAALIYLIWNLVRQGRTGQSIGKSVVGTKLVRESDAEPVGSAISIARALLHVVDALPCFVGYLNPAWDSKRQTFADKIVATVVVEAP